MHIEITEDFIRRLLEDEESVKLRKLFSDKELISLTLEFINDYLKEREDIEQAIEFTIDGLNQMYIEDTRTRYILYSVCLYRTVLSTFNGRFEYFFDKIFNSPYEFDKYEVWQREELYQSLFEDIHLYTEDKIFLRKFLFEFINVREAYIRTSNRRILYSLDRKVIGTVFLR